MIGKTISHYRILEKLGEGGMGVVYKAEDLKLKRIVALKFLPSELTRDSEAKERFIQEAQAASALDHPNICNVHEIGETEDEQIFIAMACYEGETLKDKIKCGPVDLDEAIRVAIQVSEGLAKAHARGIVHRDIKPANIIVTDDGVAKILDFGLAKLAGQVRLTRTSSTLGTVAYMSPEQARGDEVDSRTDIWSLGVVVYEMVAGQLPFRGEYEPALMYSIVNDNPRLMRSLRSGVPRELERVVEKTLAKRPDERYGSVTDLLADLRALSEEESERLRAGRLGRQEPAETGQRKKSIAVLPFRSLSDSKEDEYFSDGTTEDIIAHLSKIRELRVISRTSVMRYKHGEKSIPEIGRELGVATILEGSVRRAGGRVRIVAQLLDVQTDEHMWAETYDRDMKDVFAIQSDVAEKIAMALRAELSPVERERIERKPTESVEAYNYYLKGRFYWNKRRGDDLRTAVDYFNQAIETDPAYALAYAGLASTYVLLPEYAGPPAKEFMPKAEAAARKALEFDPALAEPHAVLGLIKRSYEWDWVGAESEFKRAIELNPSYPTAHHWYSLMLCESGRFDEAQAEIRLAQELDPLSLVINVAMGSGPYYKRQYDKAVEECKKTLELDPNFALARFVLGRAYVEQGEFEAGIAEFEKARAIVGSSSLGPGDVGNAYARAGRKSDAAKILDELLQLSRQGYSVSYDIALVYWGLGDKNQALEWLERAYEERSSFLDEIKVDPKWDGLRSDPRFVALMKKVGLEK
jgi:serine/threonine protein kinase/tetratricopeptide (TPR) repeat protein